ncbi:unnamed protein product [Prorocentrum cordatum]|uniref:Uncharacterized protein n=1 Tax=Prorocentrum cordatum TaxID=2364126 RepID=A0ABN9V3R5_9DINO|nr:unnamed protein product [Polarella glacialis]
MVHSSALPPVLNATCSPLRPDGLNVCLTRKGAAAGIAPSWACRGAQPRAASPPAGAAGAGRSWAWAFEGEEPGEGALQAARPRARRQRSRAAPSPRGLSAKARRCRWHAHRRARHEFRGGDGGEAWSAHGWPAGPRARRRSDGAPAPERPSRAAGRSLATGPTGS